MSIMDALTRTVTSKIVGPRSQSSPRLYLHFEAVFAFFSFNSHPGHRAGISQHGHSGLDPESCATMTVA
jgi:hypothetical protein